MHTYGETPEHTATGGGAQRKFTRNIATKFAAFTPLSQRGDVHFHYLINLGLVSLDGLLESVGRHRHQDLV